MAAAAIRWLNVSLSTHAVQDAIDALDDHGLHQFALLMAEEGLHGEDALAADEWHARLTLSTLCEALAMHLGLVDPRDQSLRTDLAMLGADSPLPSQLNDLGRYRAFPVEDLQDAHLELRLAATIGASSEQRADYADRLLGAQLSDWVTIETTAQALATTRRSDVGFANGWSDEDEAGAAAELRVLLPRLRAIALLSIEYPTGSSLAAPLATPSTSALMAHAQHALQAPAAIYMHVEQGARLQSLTPGCLALPISVDNRRSRIAASFREGALQRVSRWDTTAVVDQQVMTVLATEEVLLTPINAGGASVGVLVAGLPRVLNTASAQHVVTWIAGELGHVVARDRRRAHEQEEAARNIHARYAQQLREVVHEANNPLAIISNYLHFAIARVGEDVSLHEPLRRVAGEIERTAAIWQGLAATDALEPANWSRLNSGAENTATQPSLSALLRDIEGLFMGTALGKRVSFLVDTVQPEFIVANVEILRQILVNLVRNALEAVANGGAVRVRCRTNIFRNARRQAVLAIVDDGPGIRDDYLRVLADAKVSDKGAGHAGLGLALAHRLAEQIGATLDCETGEAGTTFTLMMNVT